jgi:hypothetical protein
VDVVAECSGALSADVTLDGTGSSDTDGDLLEHEWSGNFGIMLGSMPTIPFPLGTSTAELVVSDGVVESEPDSVDVTVEDTLPPEISCNAPGFLTPPEAPVSFTATAFDTCGGDVAASITDYRRHPAARRVPVTSRASSRARPGCGCWPGLGSSPRPSSTPGSATCASAGAGIGRILSGGSPAGLQPPLTFATRHRISTT